MVEICTAAVAVVVVVVVVVCARGALSLNPRVQDEVEKHVCVGDDLDVALASVGAPSGQARPLGRVRADVGGSKLGSGRHAHAAGLDAPPHEHDRGEWVDAVAVVEVGGGHGVDDDGGEADRVGGGGGGGVGGGVGITVGGGGGGITVVGGGIDVIVLCFFFLLK